MIEATNITALRPATPRLPQNIQSSELLLDAASDVATEMARRLNTPGPSESHQTYQGSLRSGAVGDIQTTMNCRSASAYRARSRDDCWCCVLRA